MKCSGVHPTAIISSRAKLGERVEVGPFAIIGDGCEVGDDCQIHPRATLERDVKLGTGVKVGIGSILGGPPQDLKYAGEETTVEVGDHTVIREYSTINRGTSQSFKTTVGSNCLLMSYVHLAHDCHIGNGVVIANGVQLAGHVIVEDKAAISGLSAVHQFVRIGRHSFIGGCSRVSKDIPPFLKAVGNPVKLYGLNSVGLQRNGFSEEVVLELKRAYRLFFRSDLNLTQAMQRAESDLERFPEVEELMRFVEESERGVVI
ncbi:MAG: acyl-ACP--UDP-N-acetylglucosamine O-acyltransferase [Gemmatimonadaceae bacterium]|nr:acyl-ACP--UDP-N-acetylglucosamine O-acyltransferase [Gemmatimonadaceae bacterium]